jgi:hypothetical protein
MALLLPVTKDNTLDFIRGNFSLSNGTHVEEFNDHRRYSIPKVWFDEIKNLSMVYYYNDAAEKNGDPLSYTFYYNRERANDMYDLHIVSMKKIRKFRD